MTLLDLYQLDLSWLYPSLLYLSWLDLFQTLFRHLPKTLTCSDPFLTHLRHSPDTCQILTKYQTCRAFPSGGSYVWALVVVGCCCDRGKYSQLLLQPTRVKFGLEVLRLAWICIKLELELICFVISERNQVLQLQSWVMSTSQKGVCQHYLSRIKLGLSWPDQSGSMLAGLSLVLIPIYSATRAGPSDSQE